MYKNSNSRSSLSQANNSNRRDVLTRKNLGKRGHFSLSYNKSNIPNRLVGNNKNIRRLNEIGLIELSNHVDSCNVGEKNHVLNKVSKRRRKNYAIILYILLSNSGNGLLTSFISYEMLSNVTGLSKKAVIRIVQSLHMFGYFEIVEECHMAFVMTSNRYRFLPIFRNKKIIEDLRFIVISLFSEDKFINILDFNSKLRIKHSLNVISAKLEYSAEFRDSKEHVFLSKKISELMNERNNLKSHKLKGVNIDLFELSNWKVAAPRELAQSWFIKSLKRNIEKLRNIENLRSF